jgi:hypothetical protein
LRFYITIGCFKELNSLRAIYNSNPNDIKMKFSSKIAELLSSFIQQIGESCYLNHQNNHFKVGSRKQGPFWTGNFRFNFRDKERKCTCSEFVFNIKELDEDKDKLVFFDCYIFGKFLFIDYIKFYFNQV